MRCVLPWPMVSALAETVCDQAAGEAAWLRASNRHPLADRLEVPPMRGRRHLHLCSAHHEVEAEWS